MYHNQYHPFPCLHCHPHSYIRMVTLSLSLNSYTNVDLIWACEIQVQHLIERCLLLHMNRDQCIEVLAKHASIRPLVTLTVWRELLEENRDCFQMYFHAISPRPFISRHIRKKARFARRKQYWK
ncbi:hypothetical protein ACSBR2_006626 [Camellia fascicularis]